MGYLHVQDVLDLVLDAEDSDRAVRSNSGAR